MLAIERVLEIAKWIAADRPRAAREMAEGIFGAVERLHDFPESGRPVPELDRAEFREVIYREYRIVYRVKGDTVEILTVRHSLQIMDEEDLGE